MIKVIVPNKQYRGVIADVQFHNGEGLFEDKKVAEMVAKKFGFLVVDETQEVAKAVPEKDVQVEKKPATKRTKKKVGEA